MAEKSDHDRLVEIHATLLGSNGQGGLCRQVEKNAQAIFRLWLAVIILAMSIGGGVFGVVKAVLAVNVG
ncbi:MAG: hypothetical protein WC417_07315 [Candidatus Omnitrophota bacterium]|jgi:hypothetical protein